MIRECTYNDLAPILIEAERAIKLKVLPNLRYWAYYDGEKIVGFVSVKLYSSKAKLHSAYVKPEYRRNGIYKQLNAVRWAFIVNAAGVKTIEANCTKDSLPFHMKRGAKVVQVYEICTKVVYSLP